MKMRAFNRRATMALTISTAIMGGCPMTDRETESGNDPVPNSEGAAPTSEAPQQQSFDAAVSAEQTDTVAADVVTSGGVILAPPTTDIPVTPPIVVPPVAPPTVNSPLFSSSPNGIFARAGGPRTDPEGVAPRADRTTLLTWRDSRGRERTMTLGTYLYQYDFTFFDGRAEVARSANDDAWGHEGFGYVVSHNTQNGNSPLGKVNPATKIESIVFAGGHHAIYRIEMLYDRDREPGGGGIKIPVVIEWMVATGRDHPIWAVNWRTGMATNPSNVNLDVYRMDSRGPYGSLNFDGAATRGAGDAIGTIAWGDFARRFGTDDEMLTLQSPWTYDVPNRVPFVCATAANVNAEMGIVRTLAGDKQMGMPDRVVGRERGSNSSQPFNGQGDCNAFGDVRVYSMPCINGWPYQMMNYDWDPSSGKPAGEATGTKLLAWGTPYGYVGASSFNLFDYSAQVSGRGDRSYATVVVLGPKARYGASGALDQPGDAALTLRQIEALADATITNVLQGTLVTELPAGPLSTQMRSASGGYDDTYAAHRLRADGGVRFTFNPNAGGVRNPLFVIENYAARTVPRVALEGIDVTVNGNADSGAFVSLDEANNRLWVTINRSLTGATEIRVSP